MNVLIVEDELVARKSLVNALTRMYPDMTIVGQTGSVTETVAWLDNPSNRADLIFLDVELSDGNCFEIFRMTDVKAAVIMTTAYDSYAIKAFEVDSTDYLLKPIVPEDLKRAVERAVSRMPSRTKSPKERLLIKLNDRIVPVRISDIAYFYSEDKSTYLVTSRAVKYIVDFSLDIVMEQLDHNEFFRISRSCIISMTAISSIVKIGSRYMITSVPEAPFEMMVSRSRTDDFLSWLEGGDSFTDRKKKSYLSGTH